MNSKLIRGALAGAALLALLAPAASADHKPKATTKIGTAVESVPVVNNLQFAIEADNRSVDPLILEPGEGFRINPGQRLEIRAVADAAGHRGKVYPGVRYFVVSGGNYLTLTDAHENKGTVAVTAKNLSGGSLRAVIGYELLDNVVPEGGARAGRIEVEVLSRRADYDAARANALVADLYRGILLREPDRGASEWAARIDRDGYDGLVQAARAIADSDESRKSVYGRGVCDQQRLLAFYKNFLGLSEPQIPMAEWTRGLELLDQRRYADLVTELLGRPEFFARRDLEMPRQIGYLRN
jgi:hypothetical protein